MALTPIQVKLAIYAGIALALVGAGAFLSYRWHEAEMLRKQQEVDAANRELAAAVGDRDAWKQAAVAQTAIADAQTKLSSKLGGALSMANASLSALKAKDPNVKAFDDMPMPDSYRRLRREQWGCQADPALPCPGSANDTGTSATGRNGGAASDRSGQPPDGPQAR